MPFLFYHYGGKVVADSRPRANDPGMDYVCVASGSLVFKFARWRSENYAIQVAPAFAPTDLYDLLDVLRLTDSTVNTNLPQLDTSWRLFGQLLEPRFRLLEEAFSPDHFPDTKVRLAQMR
jgi:hypothetical protein